jgi:serine/threonine protein kinase/tetratricopeptide (TPR) repeat protein
MAPPQITYGLQPGMVLGERYELLRFLGRGGFGRVFQATDRLLGIGCALKFLDPHLTEDEEQVNRFKREILLGRKVRHENACQIFDFGEVDGFKFISMEFVDGQSLKDRLKSGPPLSFPERLQAVLEMCAALDVAHRQGIVHRDLKLDNIMFDSAGRVKVMDFGIAHSADTANMTSSNKLLGTPLYMAPERWRGEDVGPASDIYALGVLMYQLFTGRAPFESEEIVVVCFQHINDPPPPVLSLNPEVPDALASLIERCVAKSAPDRFVDAGELGRALAALEPTGSAAAFDEERRAAPTPAVLPGEDLTKVRRPQEEAEPETEEEVEEPRPARSLAWLVAVMAVMLLASVAGLTYLLLRPDVVEGSSDGQPTPQPTAGPRLQPSPSAPPVPTPDAGVEEARAVADKLYAEGRILDDSGQLDALRAYQRVLQLRPSDTQALERVRLIAAQFQKLGDEAFEKGQFDVALEQYARALKADPGDAGLHQRFEATMERRKVAASVSQLLEDARRALARFEPKQAQELLAAALRADPSNAEARTLKTEAEAKINAVEALAAARQKLDGGDFDGAEAALGRVAAKYPDWLEPKELARGIAEARKAAEDKARNEAAEKARLEAEAAARAGATPTPGAEDAGSWRRPQEAGDWTPESVKRQRQFNAHVQEVEAALAGGRLNAARAALKKAEKLASGKDAKAKLEELRRAVDAAAGSPTPTP